MLEGLDTASKHLVLSSLAVLMHGKTTLLITHDQHVLRLVDAVIALGRSQLTSRVD